MASTKEKSVGVLESSLEKLEKLVEQLESGDLSLEESLKHFEQGVTEGGVTNLIGRW